MKTKFKVTEKTFKKLAPELNQFLEDGELDDPFSSFEGASEEDLKTMEASYKKYEDAFQDAWSQNGSDAEYGKLAKTDPGVKLFHKYVGEESGWGGQL